MTSSVKINTIEPEGATTNLVIGQSGQNTIIGNNDIRANVLQDSGGNAIFTSNGSGVLSGVDSQFGSSMVLLSTQTVSTSAISSIIFTLPTAYEQVVWRFYNVDSANDGVGFTFNVSTDGTNYNMVKTTAGFSAFQREDGAAPTVAYTGYALAQSANAQTLAGSLGNDADQCTAGEFTIFTPAGTTYVKHWMSKFQTAHYENYTQEMQHFGYINDAANDISHIKFAMSSGNIAGGTIKMWGVK